MNLQTMMQIGLTVLSLIVATYQVARRIYVAIKDKQWSTLKELLTKEIIPLMEQAERAFDNGEDKENWVIKKLSDITHIDFYKYKNFLDLALEIIRGICETTKYDINKIRVIEEKKEVTVESEAQNVY